MTTDPLQWLSQLLDHGEVTIHRRTDPVTNDEMTTIKVAMEDSVDEVVQINKLTGHVLIKQSRFDVLRFDLEELLSKIHTEITNN